MFFESQTRFVLFLSLEVLWAGALWFSFSFDHVFVRKGDAMNLEKVYDFNVGQKAVYPCHGVGTIEGIQSCSVGGAAQNFYVVKIHSTGVKVMVPTGSAKTVGLRAIVTTPEVSRVYEILKSPSKKTTTTWNRRFRALNEKLNTGNIQEIAEVLRDLSHLSTSKELSFGEKKMFEKAKQMLVSEISLAKNLGIDLVEEELNVLLLV